MTKEQRNAILDLCLVVEEILCTTCTRKDCEGLCEMRDWIYEIKETLRKGDEEK